MAPPASYHNLEGVYSEVHPDTGEDTEGVKKFFKQFTSFPGRIGSHTTPETPSSIYEAGELRYRLRIPLARSLTTPIPLPWP
ncbi:hypothetical protein ACN38_g8687 [Penicillium nordicum]|uniref:Xylulose 5-phosphate/Fructose 6-phosphate phosphoketolase N-terminal domain-containing protein n=1 Tax=Penicillium nordicum TaxID=229535 RepID=A0A0M8P4V8_9EURO|nr:hypothetical protein ACN38_g8687 [Penicillium nordicum]